MNRFLGWLAGLASCLSLVAPVEAARVHLKNSVTPTVSFDLDEESRPVVMLDAALAGLGNGDVLITAEFFGTAVVIVYNPQGHPSPGQQVPVQATGSVSIPASEVKNGTVAFSVQALIPDPTAAILPTLPNPQWSAVVDSFDFPTSITLTVQQGGKTTVFELDTTDFVVN